MNLAVGTVLLVRMFVTPQMSLGQGVPGFSDVNKFVTMFTK
jgi:hypothetical protein